MILFVQIIVENILLALTHACARMHVQIHTQTRLYLFYCMILYCLDFMFSLWSSQPLGVYDPGSVSYILLHVIRANKTGRQ